MNYVLLAFSVVLAVVKSSLVKGYTDRAPEQNSRICFFNLAAFGIAAAVQLAVSGFFALSPWTFFPALGYAGSCCLIQLFLMKSMSVGPMGLSALFCMYGMLIPALAGPVFFGESFSILKGIGAVLMVLAIFFSADLKDKSSPVNAKWFFFALATLVFSGAVGVFEKIHRTGPDKDAIDPFLSCAFVMIFVLNLFLFFFSKKREKAPAGYGNGIVFALATGLVIVCYNRINLILAGALDTMIYYPISSGGAVLLTIAVSTAFFREPLNRRSVLSIVFGTAAILLLGLF
ncbi:MAG: hypothetical protein IJV00_07805 [Clostridia bacterium]|nr:hypothetical protein [Clostridia bacterium]